MMNIYISSSVGKYNILNDQQNNRKNQCPGGLSWTKIKHLVANFLGVTVTDVSNFFSQKVGLAFRFCILI